MDFMEFVETVQSCYDSVDKIPSKELKIALLCTLFDHVCETENMDKQATLSMMVESISDVNRELGNMY